MKRLLLAFLVSLLFIDVSWAQMSYVPEKKPATSDETVLNADDEDDMTRRRRRGRRGRGRGADMGLLIAPHLSMALPMGSLGDQANFGFGGLVDGMFFVDQFGVGLSMGYHSFGMTDEALQFAALNLGAPLTELQNITGKGSINYLPIQAQAVFMFGTTELKPYIGAAAGIFSQSSKADVEYRAKAGEINGEPVFQTVSSTYSESSTNLGFAPILGMYYTLSDQMHLSGSIKYNMVMGKENVYTVTANGITVDEQNTTYGYLGINFGIGFSIGN